MVPPVDAEAAAGRIVTSIPEPTIAAAAFAAAVEAFLVSGDATLVVVVVLDEVVEEEAAAAIFASSSCSCCKPLTNAALSRFVCSAFSAFFTFVVTQFSQITRTSLPEKHERECCTVKISSAEL